MSPWKIWKITGDTSELRRFKRDCCDSPNLMVRGTRRADFSYELVINCVSCDSGEAYPLADGVLLG